MLLTAHGDAAESNYTKSRPDCALDDVTTQAYVQKMKSVDVRGLKGHLSQYLREVNAGETVEVTVRGHVVAVISPPGARGVPASVPSGLVALAERNLVTLGARTPGYRYPVLSAKRRRRVTAAQLLDEDRGDR